MKKTLTLSLFNDNAFGSTFTVPTLPGHTPATGGHRHSIQVTKTKGEHITGSLLLCWQTNIFSASYRYQPISG